MRVRGSSMVLNVVFLPFAFIDPSSQPSPSLQVGLQSLCTAGMYRYTSVWYNQPRSSIINSRTRDDTNSWRLYPARIKSKWKNITFLSMISTLQFLASILLLYQVHGMYDSRVSDESTEQLYVCYCCCSHRHNLFKSPWSQRTGSNGSSAPLGPQRNNTS